jgi:hypothetical protein
MERERLLHRAFFALLGGIVCLAAWWDGGKEAGLGACYTVVIGQGQGQRLSSVVSEVFSFQDSYFHSTGSGCEGEFADAYRALINHTPEEFGGNGYG